MALMMQAERKGAAEKQRSKISPHMELWHLMETTWTEVAPDSESLVQNFSAFLDVARIVHENEGCLVPDLAFRSGRRRLSKKHAGEKRKSNIKSRDTIATQTIPKVHPSLEEAVDILYLSLIHI